MDYKPEKYLHIHDWNYWWCFYHCADEWDDPDAAEFCLTEDEAGEEFFFHFDFYNLPALHQTIQDGEFMEPESPDYPHFLKQAERLRNGEQDWFVGALYYPNFSPNLAFCNAPVRSSVPLTQLLSPSVPPYYGVIFLREERPLSPEILTAWVERLSLPLFGWAFSCQFAEVPTRQDALRNYEEEMM
jgi:hypothetical protein